MRTADIYAEFILTTPVPAPSAQRLEGSGRHRIEMRSILEVIPGFTTESRIAPSCTLPYDTLDLLRSYY